MKKLIYSCLSIVVMMVLSGCGGPDDKKVDAMIDELESVEGLSDIITFGFALEDDRNEKEVVYDIHITVEDSFSELTYNEQRGVFENIISSIEEKEQNVSDGDVDCGEGYTCTIGELELSTDEEEYAIDYSPSFTTITLNGEPYEEQENEPEEELATDSTEVTDTSTEVTERSTDSSEEAETTAFTDTTDVDFSSASGEDWVVLSESEKISMITDAIESFNSSGRFTITEGSDWFVDALNAFYGDGTTAEDQAVSHEKVSDVMLMSGLAGGVFVE